MIAVVLLLLVALGAYTIYRGETLMASVEELRAEVEGLQQDVDEMKAAIDIEQEQVTAVLKKMDDVIDALEKNAVPEDIINSLRNARTDLKAAQDDLSSTIPDAES